MKTITGTVDTIYNKQICKSAYAADSKHVTLSTPDGYLMVSFDDLSSIFRRANIL